jgi:hypothetical protein
LASISKNLAKLVEFVLEKHIFQNFPIFFVEEITKFSQKNQFTFICVNLWTYNRGEMLNILGFHAFNINRNKNSIYMYQEDLEGIMD